jgi:alpha/beta superfamily hydrolase
MDNNVVHGLVNALAAEGVVVLRFNFRGVGGSGGTHGGGDPEQEDVKAALDALAKEDGVDPNRLAACGYSFGAWVGLRAAYTDARVRALAAVAPPLAAYSLDFLAGCQTPKLAVAGGEDSFCPPGAFESWFESLPEPKRRVVLEGADHFFWGREREVGRIVAEFVRPWLNLDEPGDAAWARPGRAFR